MYVFAIFSIRNEIQGWSILKRSCFFDAIKCADAYGFFSCAFDFGFVSWSHIFVRILVLLLSQPHLSNKEM